MGDQILFISAGLEGYLVGVGKANMVIRPLLVLADLLIGFPQPEWWWQTSIIGGVLVAILIFFMLIEIRKTENDQVERS